MFSSSTFLAAYNPTDRAIRFVNTSGKVIHTINVCNYQKSGVFGTNLKIVMEDNLKEYTLIFASNNDAKTALGILKTAVNTLKLNCVSSGGGGEAPTDPIAISYATYKTLQASNSLVALQWYDITDTANALFPSTIYTIRVLAKATNDRHPRGQILSNHTFVTIDSVTDKIIYYEDSINRNTFLNCDVANISLATSTNIMVQNDSHLTASGSTHINVENDSQAVVTDSSNVNITNESDVNITNASNVELNNIQQDLSSLPFNLQDVSIDRNNSIGKNGRAQTADPGNLTFRAYNNTVNQDLLFTVSDSEIDVTLINDIPQANAEFKLKYTGAGTGNIITIKDSGANTIFEINDSHKNKYVIFQYNKTTEEFELMSVQNAVSGSGKLYLFDSVTNAQTNFDIDYPVSIAGDTEMYVNGQKMIYGLDFSYNSVLKQVVYADRNFPLSTDDEVEIKVF